MLSSMKWGVAVATLVWVGTAGGVPLDGSLTLGSGGVSPDPGALDMVTSFTAPSSGFYSTGSGSFLDLTGGTSGLTQLLTFSPSPITIPFGTGAAASNLTVTGSGAASGFGTFAASTAQVIMRSASFLDLYFLGTYTPDFTPAGGGTYDPGEAASLRLDLTRTGSATGGYSVSLAGSLAVPPAGITVTPTSTPISEPASMALLGAGLLGLGVARRRKEH